MTSMQLRTACLWICAISAALLLATGKKLLLDCALGFGFAALLLHVWHRYWHPPPLLPRSMSELRAAQAARTAQAPRHQVAVDDFELDEFIPIDSPRLPDSVRQHAQRFRATVTHAVALGNDGFMLVADDDAIVDLIHLK